MNEGNLIASSNTRTNKWIQKHFMNCPKIENKFQFLHMKCTFFFSWIMWHSFRGIQSLIEHVNKYFS